MVLAMVVSSCSQPTRMCCSVGEKTHVRAWNESRGGKRRELLQNAVSVRLYWSSLKPPWYSWCVCCRRWATPGWVGGRPPACRCWICSWWCSAHTASGCSSVPPGSRQCPLRHGWSPASMQRQSMTFKYRYRYKQHFFFCRLLAAFVDTLTFKWSIMIVMSQDFIVHRDTVPPSLFESRVRWCWPGRQTGASVSRWPAVWPPPPEAFGLWGAQGASPADAKCSHLHKSFVLTAKDGRGKHFQWQDDWSFDSFLLPHHWISPTSSTYMSAYTITLIFRHSKINK